VEELQSRFQKRKAKQIHRRLFANEVCLPIIIRKGLGWGTPAENASCGKDGSRGGGNEGVVYKGAEDYKRNQAFPDQES